MDNFTSNLQYPFADNKFYQYSNEYVKRKLSTTVCN